MTAGGIDRATLEEFRRELFGFSGPGRTIPPSYVATLFTLIKPGDHRLGVVETDTQRRAYWVRGRTLGTLGCEGSTDADAVSARARSSRSTTSRRSKSA